MKIFRSLFAKQHLEQEGYLCCKEGEGLFAAGQSEIDAGRRRTLLGQFDAACVGLLFLGMTVEELIQRLRAAETAGACKQAPAKASADLDGEEGQE